MPKVIYEWPKGPKPTAGYVDGMTEFLEDEDTRFPWIKIELETATLKGTSLEPES